MKKTLKKYLPLIIKYYLWVLFFFLPKKAVKKAHDLFCTPRKGKVLLDQEYFLETALDEIIVVDNKQIQTYRWANDGETILMVHGWESNTYRWRVLIKKLHRKGYNIIAFDAPAHGKSSGKLFNVVIYEKCIQKIIELYRPNHIIGHSVGGMAAVYHQYKNSNKEIEKLILLAPPSELSRIMKEYQKIIKLSPKFMKALDMYFKHQYGFSFEEFSIAKFAKQITTKALLIHDKNDPIVPYREALSIYEHWKELKLISTSDQGHSLATTEVNMAIIDFLKD